MTSKQTPVSTHPSNALATGALLVSATLWGLIWYPLRLLEQGGIGGLWSALIMYTAIMLLGLPWLWRYRVMIASRRRSFLLIALFGGWCNIAFILAVLDGHIVRVMLLFYLSPIWAVLLARFYLGEHFTWKTVIMLGLSLAGMLSILWHTQDLFGSETGLADLYALTSGMAFAAINITVRCERVLNMPVKAVSAWLGVCVMSAAGVALTAEPLAAVAPVYIVGAVLLGVIGIAVMTLAVTYGVTHLPAQRSAVILLFELVVASLSASLLTSETVSLQEWLGGVLIVSAALLAAFSREAQSELEHA